MKLSDEALAALKASMEPVFQADVAKGLISQSDSDELMASVLDDFSKEESTEEMVTIPLKKYQELVESDIIYSSLVSAGVDNWDFYEESIDRRKEYALYYSSDKRLDLSELLEDEE